MPAFAADLFGPANVGSIYGLMLTAWGFAGVVGPTLIARIRETTGHYTEALDLIAVVMLVSAVIPVLRSAIRPADDCSATSRAVAARNEVLRSQAVVKKLLDGWPLVQQILHRTDGTGLEARSQQDTRPSRPKNHGADVARSVCPLLRVGCGQLIYHKNGQLISIEGNAESPVSRGRLVPEGSGQLRAPHPPGRA